MKIEKIGAVHKIEWEGKILSVNEWHGMATRQSLFRETKSWIYSQKEYNDFINRLSWTIRAQIPGITYERCDIIIDTVVSDRFDHHNAVKPIMDAIERSCVVNNDRNVETIILMPPKRHKRGGIDKLILQICEKLMITEL